MARDVCLTRDKFALGINQFSFTIRRVYCAPKFITLITFYHVYRATAETSPFCQRVKLCFVKVQSRISGGDVVRQGPRAQTKCVFSILTILVT